MFPPLLKLILEIIRQLHDLIGPKCFRPGTLCILLSGGCQDCAVTGFRVSYTWGAWDKHRKLAWHQSHLTLCLGSGSMPIVAVQCWKGDKDYSHFLVYWSQSDILKRMKRVDLGLSLSLNYIQCDWNSFICNTSKPSIFHKLPRANNILLCLLHPTLSNIWMINFLKPYWSFI